MARSVHVGFIVDKLHVGTSDISVIREFARRLPRRSTTKRQRKVVYREALRQHHENQRLYSRVMSGRF